MNKHKLSKGKLLIAEPSIIGDISFHRTVILLTDYSENGTVGFIINKPLKYNINNLISKIDADFIVYNGGPVEQDNLYFIHNIPNLIPKSIEIDDDLYWGGDFEIAVELINKKEITNKNIRFFLGYTGWSSKQLEREIESKSWYLDENKHKETLIEKKAKNMWKRKMSALGGDYLIWANAPENPLFN